MSDTIQTEGFAEFIGSERMRLADELASIRCQQDVLYLQIDAINREMAAIDAYEAAKAGKKVLQVQAGRQPRARRGNQREVLLELIRNSPAGISRGGLIEVLGVKGDKSGEMSVSNALTGLVKRNGVRREGGKYFLSAPVEGFSEHAAAA